MHLAVYATFLLLAISSCGYFTAATLGIDVSTPVSKSDFTCLKNAGYDFLIVRAYRSLGSPDPNAPDTIRNAHEAGIKNVDVYIFPCPKCSKSASDQVKEMGK